MKVGDKVKILCENVPGLSLKVAAEYPDGIGKIIRADGTSCRVQIPGANRSWSFRNELLKVFPQQEQLNLFGD